MELTLEALDEREILRYLQYPGQPDPQTQTLVNQGMQTMLRAIRPRYIYRLFNLLDQPDGVMLQGGMLLPGSDIKQHLSGCARAAVMAVTLSAGADGAIRSAQSTDMGLALVLDACATVAVELACDRVEAEIKGQFTGMEFPFRYSPGYGNLPIELQNDLLKLLDAPRKIGLCATDTHILTPRKSVTAILGIGGPGGPGGKGCEHCNLKDNCQYKDCQKTQLPKVSEGKIV